MLKNNFLETILFTSVAHRQVNKKYIKNMSKIFKLISHGK